MNETLLIVESPAKAKSIGKLLGKKYKVIASMGHIRDLPKSQLGVDIEHNFEPKYISIRGKGEIIKKLKAAVKKADRVLLASDPDREGEAIAWHLQYLLGLEPESACRIEFNEITQQSIQEAVQTPRPIDAKKVDAQQARRILDRLVGYKLSPLLWRKIKKGLSAGRVQSVAVRMICDREEEINDFTPEEYWSLTAFLNKTGEKPGFEAKLSKIKGKKAVLPDRETVQRILADLEGCAYQVKSISQKEKKRHPAQPFTTSTLQQEAYRKLNYTSRKTMLIAQQLYEGIDLGKEGPVGLVSYIRTDSIRVSETTIAEVRDYIKEEIGSEYLPKQARKTTVKGRIQDAHEAIRPTSVRRTPDKIKDFLSNDQFKLYRLIWSRFVASQMKDALFYTTGIDIEAGDYIFRATGSILHFPGFMKIYTDGSDEQEKSEQTKLPDLAEGDLLNLEKLEPKQHFTQPPPRYTDATLIKSLEEKGIGRPSTYAPIVETILKRGYIVRENKQLYPTELGNIVIKLLKNHFDKIIDIEFTADMEQKLDQIAEGNQYWRNVIGDFYYPFAETLDQAEEELSKVDLAEEVSEEICEFCGCNLVVKLSKFGKFLACPGFPECRNTKPLLEPTGVKCPRCDGEIVLRRSKKGRVFYGCSSYPDCDFMIWDEPVQEKCPECGGLMVKKSRRKQDRLYCINENCSQGQKYKNWQTENKTGTVAGTKKSDK